MTEEKTLEENLDMYSYAAVASRVFPKDERGTKFCIDKLVGKISQDEDLIGFVKHVRGEKGGDKRVIDYFSGRYDKVLGGSKVGDLRTLYSHNIEDYFEKGKDGEEGAREKADALFEKFRDENYGSVRKKMAKAKVVLESGEEAFNKDEIADAEKTLRKYGKLATLIEIFEEDKITKLAEPIRKKSRKALANDILMSGE